MDRLSTSSIWRQIAATLLGVLLGSTSQAGDMPPFERADAWLNSRPLGPNELEGKVVLVQFWTYTCINWRRTVPYVRAWANRYTDHGLVVVGVHTPEFSFEKDITNVRMAVDEQRIAYPVVVDNDYAIWRAFDNRYWLALYIVDARGHIRHRHFGEGEYEASERVIQQLLAGAGHAVSAPTLVTVHASGAEPAADWRTLKSPETYLGYNQAQRFVSSSGVAQDRSRTYTAPQQLRRNEWALDGKWMARREFVESVDSNAKVVYRFTRATCT